MSHDRPVEIKTLLFISGFTILSLEILGIRILAPYIGSTIPVWAAVVGIPLFGSAVGYYGGGILADRVQRKEILVWLAAAASVYIALIPALRGVVGIVAPHVSYGVSAIIGASSLFLVPITLLSALTVYVIRIFVKSLDSIGQTHGDLYALATVGSVVGVFGTSYLLIPFFTIPHILYALGALVVLSSLRVYMAPYGERSKTNAG
ncbi:MAG: fused MFS/spermidine synthase [Patescibacteria group bacterium]